MVYIIFFSIISYISYLLEKKNKSPLICTLIVGTLLSLLIGLRGSNIGNDTQTYLTLFYDFNIYDNFWISDNKTELGYVLLNRFLGLITNDAHIAILIMTFMMIMPLVYTIFKYSSMPWFSILLIFCFGFFSFFLSGIRQSIVFCLLFAALPWLEKHQTIKFTLLVLILTYIHTTAIFALILVPCVYIKKKNIFVLPLLAASFLCVVFFDQILDILAILMPRYEHYFNGSYFNGTGWLASLFNLMITIVMVVFIMTYSQNDSYGHKLFDNGIKLKEQNSHVFEWSIILTIALQIIGIRANVIDRITSYTQLPWLLYIPYIASKIKNPEHKEMFIMLVILLYVAKFVIIQVLRPEWNHILPFQFFWI